MTINGWQVTIWTISSRAFSPGIKVIP
jgi:hypothetical protein